MAVVSRRGGGTSAWEVVSAEAIRAVLPEKINLCVLWSWTRPVRAPGSTGGHTHTDDCSQVGMQSAASISLWGDRRWRNI